MDLIYAACLESINQGCNQSRLGSCAFQKVKLDLDFSESTLGGKPQEKGENADTKDWNSIYDSVISEAITIAIYMLLINGAWRKSRSASWVFCVEQLNSLLTKPKRMAIDYPISTYSS